MDVCLGIEMTKQKIKNILKLHIPLWKGKALEVVMKMTEKAPLQGTLLPNRKAPWRPFVGAFALQIFAVAAAVFLTLLLPKEFNPLSPRLSITAIAAARIKPWKPRLVKPTPHSMLHDVPTQPPTNETPIPKPTVYLPVASSPAVRSQKQTTTVDTPEISETAKLAPIVDSPISTGNSAIPTLKKPREAVQTGSFGDPDGLPANDNQKRSPDVGHLGGFGLPPGAGDGNGTSGNRNTPGTVASAGFGNGIAMPGNGGGGHREVKQGLFNEESGGTSPKLKHVSATTPGSTPVEILSKPRPDYTEAARTKKIEGEVLLQVVFLASGQIQVQQVVKGLGYGLDESAEAAASQIRFKPAQQGGQPIDSTAVVHIVFELAY
jgi:TonB family protein